MSTATLAGLQDAPQETPDRKAEWLAESADSRADRAIILLGQPRWGNDPRGSISIIDSRTIE